MYLTQSELRKDLFHRFEALLQILQIYYLALFYQWEYDVYLSALSYLVADAVVQTRHLVVVFMDGLYGFPSWRQLIDDTHVKVAVDGHSQRTWNGCCCHDEDVRWVNVFIPQLCPLCHTEAVLLIDDGKAKTVEHHWVFDDGMCAHQDMYFARGQSLQYLFALLAFDNACKQFYAQVHTF